MFAVAVFVFVFLFTFVGLSRLRFLGRSDGVTDPGPTHAGRVGSRFITSLLTPYFDRRFTQ